MKELFCVNSNKLVTELTLENYQMTNYFQTFEKGERMEPLIFDEYNTDSKFSFVVNTFVRYFVNLKLCRRWRIILIKENVILTHVKRI